MEANASFEEELVVNHAHVYWEDNNSAVNSTENVAVESFCS